MIAFNGSSIPEVAGDACILMNNMNSKSELSSNIIKLGSDKNFRKTLVDKGNYSSKKNEFTWENCLKKNYFRSVYECLSVEKLLFKK